MTSARVLSLNHPRRGADNGENLCSQLILNDREKRTRRCSTYQGDDGQ